MTKHINPKTLAKAKQANADAVKKTAIAVQAKARKDDMLAKVKVDTDKLAKAASNVVPLARAVVVATTGDDTGKGFNIDLTIKGAMPLDAAAKGTRLKSRTHTVTAEVLSSTEALFDSNALGAEIAKLQKNAVELQWYIASFCVAIAARLQRDKTDAMPLLAEFMTAISGLGQGMTMIRTNSIKAWFLKFAPVVWDKPTGKDQKTFVFDKKKHHEQASQFAKRKEYFTTRLGKPFWLVDPEKDFSKFDFDATFAEIMKKAAKYASMTDAERIEQFGPNGLNLGNFAAIKDLLLTIRNDAKAESEAPTIEMPTLSGTTDKGETAERKTA